MYYKPVLTFVGCVLVLIIFSSFSLGGIAQPLTLAELSDGSTDIIRGNVVSIESFYLDTEKTKIFSSIHIQVVETYKGVHKTNNIIEIVRYGGDIGEKHTFSPDEARFTKGENTILFLREYTSKQFGLNYAVYGMGQGKFNIQEEFVSRDNAPYQLKLSRDGQALFGNEKHLFSLVEFTSELNKCNH